MDDIQSDPWDDDTFYVQPRAFAAQMEQNVPKTKKVALNHDKARVERESIVLVLLMALLQVYSIPITLISELLFCKQAFWNNLFQAQVVIEISRRVDKFRPIKL